MRADECAPTGRGALDERAPPTTAILMGSTSLLVKSRRAFVARPLTSLTPKISASGKATETVTARLGVTGSLTASSGCDVHN